MERGDERAEKTGACQEEAGSSSQLACRCSRPEERQVIISSPLEEWDASSSSHDVLFLPQLSHAIILTSDKTGGTLFTNTRRWLYNGVRSDLTSSVCQGYCSTKHLKKHPECLKPLLCMIWHKNVWPWSQFFFQKLPKSISKLAHI